MIRNSCQPSPCAAPVSFHIVHPRYIDAIPERLVCCAAASSLTGIRASKLFSLNHDAFITYVDEHLESLYHLVLLYNFGLERIDLFLFFVLNSFDFLSRLCQLAPQVSPNPILG